MAFRDIVVIGASAGGIEAIREVVRVLPADFPASLFLAIHLPSDSRSTLPEIVSRSGPLPAVHPEDRSPIRKGVVHVAPPDHHLLVDDGHVRVVRGPDHNRHRPAVDPLFRSASRSYGNRVIGVVLSGTLDDGTAGIVTIVERGGAAIVQDPATATFVGMPESALRSLGLEQGVALSDLGPAIRRAVAERVSDEKPTADERLDAEFHSYLGKRIEMDRIGKPSTFTCPECSGALWEADENGVLGYRCRVGHSFSSEGLMSEQDEALEVALWAALRALEERAQLRRRMTERFRRSGNGTLARRTERQANESEQHAERLRELLARTNAETLENTE